MRFRRSGKYNAKRTEVDGITFASMAEARRYQELKMLQSAGEIEELELQPSYDLIVNNIKVCAYRGDFRYRDRRKGLDEVVEDVKGVRTREFVIKAKLMRALFGIDVREVQA